MKQSISILNKLVTFSTFISKKEQKQINGGATNCLCGRCVQINGTGIYSVCNGGIIRCLSGYKLFCQLPY
jgi:hypothetical protein